LDLLTNFECRHSKVLLENYVFKIIPILNPDGVARGYWRFDTMGSNLNRCYKNPKPDLHPTILAAKNAVKMEHETGRLKLYVDFHAHCTNRGAFIFGNQLKNLDQHYEGMMIPKLMSLNSVNFDFKECNFKDEANNVVDHNGDSRLGSGRACIFQVTDSNPLVYTLESNYVTGFRINTLNHRFDVETGEIIQKEDSNIQDSSSTLYRKGKSPVFTPLIFQDIGHSLLISLLDYDMINPVTRLINKQGDTFE